MSTTLKAVARPATGSQVGITMPITVVPRVTLRNDVIQREGFLSQWNVAYIAEPWTRVVFNPGRPYLLPLKKRLATLSRAFIGFNRFRRSS